MSFRKKDVCGSILCVRCPPAQTNTVSDGNWVFRKPLPMGKHVIYFKGGLKRINVTSTSGSNSNYTFAGPYGWDFPSTYHLTVTKSFK